MSWCSSVQYGVKTMLALRNCGVLHFVLYRHGLLRNISVPCLRGFATTHQEANMNDMPIKMENPFKEPQKTCILCNVSVDCKNVQLLSQFISPHTGRIYGRHITGLCGQKQREITKAIKRARSMGYMSVTLKDPQFMKDPNICNIRHLE